MERWTYWYITQNSLFFPDHSNGRENITVKEWKSLNFYLSYLSGKVLWIIKIYSLKLWTSDKMFSSNFYSLPQICIINKK